MNTSGLNLDFFPFYASGKAIRVEVGGTEKTGKVGVSQGKAPSFWLISSGRVVCELTKTCKYLGPAMRKTRVDSRAYLGKKVAEFHIQGEKANAVDHAASIGDRAVGNA